MPEVARWFERKFDFDFPAELYPNICIRLRGTPARLEEIVISHSRNDLIRKEDDKWSAQEISGHLLDLEPLWLARVEDFKSGTKELTVADLNNRKTCEARHNDRDIRDIVRNFRVARQQLLTQLSALDVAGAKKTALHPRLKTSMRLVDHLFFVAEHDDHHLAQIWAMLND